MTCLLTFSFVDDYLQQIEAALNGQLWVIATIGALTLPDICGALRISNGQATGQRYARWFDEHVGPLGYDGWLSGRDCYKVRCSLLHQGSAQHPSSSIGRILLFPPTHATRVHLAAMSFGPEKCLVLDAERFGKDLVSAARNWWQTVQNDAPVQSNFGKFVRYWPTGIMPYIGGSPVIG